MRTLAILLLCFTTPLLTAQEDVPSAPKIAVRIDLGTTVALHDISIQFMEVLEDSRCPKEVVCVWSGQARVKVKVSGPDLPEQELELIVGNKDQNLLFSGEAFSLKAEALTPYPTTENMGNRAYALLVVDEKH